MFFRPTPCIFDRIQNRRHQGERKFGCRPPCFGFISPSLSIFFFNLSKIVVEKVPKIACFSIQIDLYTENTNWNRETEKLFRFRIQVPKNNKKCSLRNVTVFWFFDLQNITFFAAFFFFFFFFFLGKLHHFSFKLSYT